MCVFGVSYHTPYSLTIVHFVFHQRPFASSVNKSHWPFRPIFSGLILKLNKKACSPAVHIHKQLKLKQDRFHVFQ